MRAAEGVARIEQIAIVADVDGCERKRQPLSKILSDRQVECRMRRKMLGTVAVQKTRAEIQIAACRCVPRKPQVITCAQGIALVMIQEEVSHVRGREVCKAAGYGTRALGVLMGVCQVNPGAMENFG